MIVSFYLVSTFTIDEAGGLARRHSRPDAARVAMPGWRAARRQPRSREGRAGRRRRAYHASSQARTPAVAEPAEAEHRRHSAVAGRAPASRTRTPLNRSRDESPSRAEYSTIEEIPICPIEDLEPVPRVRCPFAHFSEPKPLRVGASPPLLPAAADRAAQRAARHAIRTTSRN